VPFKPINDGQHAKRSKLPLRNKYHGDCTSNDGADTAHTEYTTTQTSDQSRNLRPRVPAGRGFVAEDNRRIKFAL